MPGDNLEQNLLSLKNMYEILEYQSKTYLNFDKKMTKRAKYAEKLKIPFVLFVGEDEKNKNIFSLKNFQNILKIENLDFEKIIKILK